MEHKQNSDIIIIGAGFAGLAAGIYAQMNGYKTQIFEMHDRPGGLCTSWERKGYTIDGCIHWLVGSSPSSGMHDLWEEVGVAQNRQFIDIEEYMRFEDSDGRTLIVYADIDKLEEHLLTLSPGDKKPISEFIKGVRMCMCFDPPSKHLGAAARAGKGINTLLTMLRHGPTMKRWMKTTAAEFAARFKDPLLAEAFRSMWIPEFSMFFMLFMFAYMHTKNAGYPLGGSLPMSRDMAKRYESLGGIIHYKKKVEKILTSQNKAYGVRLEDGQEHHSRFVISAADGYTTIFKMLRGKYGDFKTSEPYEKWPVFSPLLYVSIGVNKSFADEPVTTSGICFRLVEPLKIAGSEVSWLSVHSYHHDPGMAPEGKTTLITMLATSYAYWLQLANNKEAYRQEKADILGQVVGALEQRYPGISNHIEMTDVATPLTFERYTGNWKGSFEGWLITPDNAGVLIKKMPQTITGLHNFYMCGQWVEPGGGLPTSVMSAKRLVKTLCKLDNKKFKSDVN